MKCAKDYLDVKIAQSNINLDLSVKMDTGSNLIVDIFIMFCFSMLLVFYYFPMILLSNLVPSLKKCSIHSLLSSMSMLTRQIVTPLWNAA